MDPILALYLFGFCGLLAATLPYALVLRLYRWLGPAAHTRIVRAKHWMLMERPVLLGGDLLQLCLVIPYCSINAVVLIIGVEDLRTLEARTAVVGSINLMVAYLGGRTNPLVDFAQIALPTYYFAHRWIGGIAICEVLLHSILALCRLRTMDTFVMPASVVRVKETPIARSHLTTPAGCRMFFDTLNLLHLLSQVAWEIFPQGAPLVVPYGDGRVHLACSASVVDHG